MLKAVQSPCTEYIETFFYCANNCELVAHKQMEW